MKKMIISLLVLCFFFQACHRGMSQDSTKVQLVPDVFETASKFQLTAGTRVNMACYQSPLMKDLRTSQIFIVKTTNPVLADDGEVLIPAGSNGVARVVRIEAKGKTAPDAVTIRLESVSAADGQVVPIKSEPFTFSVNLYDYNAPLLKKDKVLTGMVSNDVMLKL